MVLQLSKKRVVCLLAGMSLVGTGLAATSASTAEAVEKGQCVAYVDGIFETTAGTNYTARGSGVCYNAKSVSVKFLMRYRDWRGWHTQHNVSKNLGSVADGWDLGWFKVPNAGTSAVYAEATVCYTISGVKKCRSDSESS